MAIEKKVNTRFTAKDGITKRFGFMEKAAARFGRKAEKSFVRANRAGGGLISRLTSARGIVAGLAAGIATGALANSIKKTAELGDEAAKTARRLGITAEALQEVRFAADRQGVSAGVLNSSFTALQKRVGELKVGTGALFTLFNKTGDTAFRDQLINAKDVNEAFMILTKRMEMVKNPMDRAALASAAFSRAGVDMLKFMEAGTDGIEKLRLEAQKYGGIIDDLSAENAELFIDSMTNMEAAIKGVKIMFVTQLFPAITKVMQGFADYVAANRDVMKLKIKEFLISARDTFNQLRPAVATVFNWMVSLAGIIEKYQTIIPVLIGGFVAYKAVLGALAIGTSIAQFIQFIGVIRNLSATTGILNAVMTANPIGAIIVGITALISLFVFLEKKFDLFSTAFDFWADKAKSFANFLGFGDGEITVNGGGVETDEATPRPAPNARQAEAQALQAKFQGRLDIAGAPPGSTLTTGGDFPSASGFDVNLLGAN